MASTNGVLIDRQPTGTKNFVEESLAQLVQSMMAEDEQDPELEQDEAFFVADMGEVYRQHARWKRCPPRVAPFYAVKCNPDREVLRLLALLGTGFDCSSRKEMEMVLSLGVRPEQIIYAQPCKHPSHLRFARRHGIRKITFDGEDELYKIKELYPGAQLLLRIATDDSSSRCRFSAKFGAPLETTNSLLKTARDLSLDLVGVSFHIGSAATDPELFVKALQDSLTVFEQARKYGYTPSLMDVGGGFSAESFDAISQTLREALDLHFPSNVRVIAEPGRYFAATAFTVACKIIARRELWKEGGESHFMLTLNDGVYGSFMDCYLSHWQRQPRILQCASKEVPSQAIRYTIWEPTCDGVDQVVENANLDRFLNVGDWLFFPDMGAYSLCLSTSFNGFSTECTVHHTSSDPAARALLGYPAIEGSDLWPS
ncbi:MAG: hypothetical protein Q9216_001623 [Gyalolechia sp. 2 TL-2023]